MAAYSMKKMGKEVGPASTYAKPHTMSGKAAPIKSNPGKEPNRSDLATLDVTIGNIAKGGNGAPKTSGIKVRGTGAATKGLMARGPMA